jgi:hypothetical protein
MTNEDLRKAARILEAVSGDYGHTNAVDCTRLAAGLLAMADAEPVGYWGGEFTKDGGADLYEVPQESCFGRVYKNLQLYATPQRPQWIGLTDSEIDSLQATTGARDDDIRIIEAALRAKNGGA